MLVQTPMGELDITVKDAVSLPYLPLVVDVKIDTERVAFVLNNGGELSFPLTMFPRVLAATPESRAKWEIRWGGEAVRWPHADEDVSIRQLLTGEC